MDSKQMYMLSERFLTKSEQEAFEAFIKKVGPAKAAVYLKASLVKKVNGGILTSNQVAEACTEFGISPRDVEL